MKKTNFNRLIANKVEIEHTPDLFPLMKVQNTLSRGLALMFLFFCITLRLNGQGVVTFESGSYIVNMGLHANVRATDISRELKPYGMVYDLLKNYNVPVYVVIDPNKVKDGPDFVYNGVVYRGGTFIINKKNITPAVATDIASWNAQVFQQGHLNKTGVSIQKNGHLLNYRVRANSMLTPKTDMC